MLFVFLSVSFVALFLVGLSLVCYVAIPVGQRLSRKDSGIYFSSSSSETSGSSSETSSGSFKGLITGKHRKHTPEQLCSSGKRYLRQKPIQENTLQGIGNQGHNIPSLDDLANVKTVPVTSHHNTVYYFE